MNKEKRYKRDNERKKKKNIDKRHRKDIGFNKKKVTYNF